MNADELIQKCAEKDSRAWGMFISRYRPLVLRSIRYKLKTLNLRLARVEAQDIAQEVFLSIWEKDKLQKIRNPEHLRTWLAMVSLNATMNYCRKHVFSEPKGMYSLEASLSKEEGSLSLGEILPAQKFNTGDSIAYNDLHSTINKEIEKFSAKQQLVLKFNFFEGRSCREISRIMKVPEGTVSAIVSRCRRRLKPRLDRILKDDAGT